MFGLLLAPSLNYSATFLHADAPALGLMAIACLLTARAGGPGVAAAVVAGLAVMTKQTMVTLPPALLLATWSLSGWRAAVRFGAILSATGAVFLAIGLLFLDREDLVLNLVKIPGGVPWRGKTPFNLFQTATELGLHGLPILAALGWLRLVFRAMSRPCVGHALS